MKVFTKVRGTMDKVSSLEVNKDTVYVRSNITEIIEEDFTGWEYDEIQYDKDEYIAKVGLDNKHLQTLVADLGEEMLLGGIV